MAKTGAVHSSLLKLPIPTVAAINGHAFAAGAILALACDFRLMREDCDRICLSEVDVDVPIGDKSMTLLEAKLSRCTLRNMVLTGERYPAEEAITAGIVDSMVSAEESTNEVTQMAASLASKERAIFNELKRTLYGRVAEGLGTLA
ncbi:MAG: enoyl-CoA hydratase-related protein [Pseudomonadales bacterium]